MANLDGTKGNKRPAQTMPLPCWECKGTGKLVYSNTGIENDCMYCEGSGVKPRPLQERGKQ